MVKHTYLDPNSTDELIKRLKSKINGGSAVGCEIKVVDSLPLDPKEDVIYTIKNDNSYLYLYPKHTWIDFPANTEIIVDDSTIIRDKQTGKYATFKLSSTSCVITLYNSDDTVAYARTVNIGNRTVKWQLVGAARLYYNNAFILAIGATYGWSTNIEYNAVDSGGWIPIVTPLETNRNLLINPDFKINQRGLTSVTSTIANTKMYLVDRWCLDGVGSASLNDDGSITLTGTLSQYIDTPMDDALVYASIDGDNINDYGYSNGRFYISGNGNTVIRHAKLEFGTKPTIFIPPDPEIELIKCQAYYQKLFLTSGTAYVGYGFFTSDISATCFIPLPTTLRTSPTVKVSNNLYLNTFGHIGANSIKINNPSGGTYSKNGYGTNFSIPTTSGVSGQFCHIQLRDMTSYIEFDSEIY